MDDNFSGVVRLSNISDFIAPNLDCIIPLESVTVKKEKKPSEVVIKKKEEKSVEAKDSIKISLADCLACNGCITSAETVLIEEQSLKSVWQGVNQKKLSVISVSPQAVCSIAAKLNVATEEAAKRISVFFKSRGVTHVVDTSFGRQLSLSLAYDELVGTPSTSRPLLSSACPGFVCYAEKSQGELMVPKISKIRSPQAIHGALVKNYLALKVGLSPCDVYHATVMPCFDKKLEASRTQFLSTGTNIRETDCVISTAEVYEELVAITQQAVTEVIQDGWLANFSEGKLIGTSGGTSGGYAYEIVEKHLKHHGGTLKAVKLNKHMEELNVTSDDGQNLRVVRVYGFRNIQNLVRKMKTGKAKYDYVEIMACPGGCGNGGGQIKEQTVEARDAQLMKVETLYEGIPKNDSEEEMRILTEEWSQLNSDYKSLLFTDYEEVKANIAQTLRW